MVKSPRASAAVSRLRRAGFHDDDIARAVGAAPGSASDWAAGSVPEPQVKARLVELHGLVGKLEEGGMFPPERIGGWFRTPKPGLGGRAPIDVVKSGDFARVEAFVTGLLYGYPT